MVTLSGDSTKLVLAEPTRDGRAGVDYQALSPILLGFMCPFVLILLVNPVALQHARFVIVLTLILVFVLAAVAFIHSALTPGETTGVVFDRQAEIATITRRGAFSSRSLTVAFDDIDWMGVTTQYDQDGYPTETPEMYLASGEVIALPQGSSAGHLSSISKAIGIA